jgi:hypothetical protein
VVNFTPRPLYPRERAPCIYEIGVGCVDRIVVSDWRIMICVYKQMLRMVEPQAAFLSDESEPTVQAVMRNLVD